MTLMAIVMIMVSCGETIYFMTDLSNNSSYTYNKKKAKNKRVTIDETTDFYYYSDEVTEKDTLYNEFDY